MFLGCFYSADRIKEILLAYGLADLLKGKGSGGPFSGFSGRHVERRLARASSWPRGPGRYDALVPGRDDIPYYGSGLGDHLDDDEPDDSALYRKWGRSSDAVAELPPGARPTAISAMLDSSLDGWRTAWAMKQMAMKKRGGRRGGAPQKGAAGRASREAPPRPQYPHHGGQLAEALTSSCAPPTTMATSAAMPAIAAKAKSAPQLLAPPAPPQQTRPEPPPQAPTTPVPAPPAAPSAPLARAAPPQAPAPRAAAQLAPAEPAPAYLTAGSGMWSSCSCSSDNNNKPQASKPAPALPATPVTPASPPSAEKKGERPSPSSTVTLSGVARPTTAATTPPKKVVAPSRPKVKMDPIAPMPPPRQHPVATAPSSAGAAGGSAAAAAQQPPTLPELPKTTSNAKAQLSPRIVSKKPPKVVKPETPLAPPPREPITNMTMFQRRPGAGMGHLGSAAGYAGASPGFAKGYDPGAVGMAAASRLSSSNKGGTGLAALPPECSQPAPWKGADKRWANFMKSAGSKRGGRGGEGGAGEAAEGQSTALVVPAPEIRRKPLYPTLWHKVPRAVAVSTLVLRRGVELDSEAIGNLLPGSEIFVMDRRAPEADGSVRALVADTPLVGKEPLGWVTAVKDGMELLDYMVGESAMPTVDGATGFFTSISRASAAPVPQASARSARSGDPSPRSSRSIISSRGGNLWGNKLLASGRGTQDAPKASGRKDSPAPRLRSRGRPSRDSAEGGGGSPDDGGGDAVML